MSQNCVIKLGGSVVSREDCLFDFDYMTRFRELIERSISNDRKFGIVLGGGYTMRKYRDLAMSEGKIEKKEDLHWIGTTVNVLHAEIVRAVFGDTACKRPFVYEDYYNEKVLEMDKPVIIGGGGRAGHSGDVDAILLAEKMNAAKVISLKNIEKLYTADPKYHPDAKPLDHATWEEYFEIIGHKSEHEPGGNYVVDPIAAKMASEKKISFVILEGKNLPNVLKYLSGEEFVGSVIGNK